MTIIELIEQKIKEHKFEIDGSAEDISLLEGPKDIKVAQKIIILKDKIMFHKAAILTLDDLKNDILKGIINE